jgi:hypothetical protein
MGERIGSVSDIIQECLDIGKNRSITGKLHVAEVLPMCHSVRVAYQGKTAGGRLWYLDGLEHDSVYNVKPDSLLKVIGSWTSHLTRANNETNTDEMLDALRKLKEYIESKSEPKKAEPEPTQDPSCNIL